MNSDSTVEVFILSRNRLDYLPEAIESILRQDFAQKFAGMRLILSDNSTDSRVTQFMSATHPSIEVRRRSGLTAYEHLNQVLGEIAAPYFMIFHDDDVLEPTAVRELIAALEKNPRASAAAANARVIYGNSLSDERLNPSLKKDLVLSRPVDLIERYFDFSLGVNPFPGYLYRRAVIGDLRFDVSEGGQYTDVTFLAQAVERGPLVWLAKPLMRYRKHGQNHSATASLLSAKQAIRFLEKQNYLPPHSRAGRLFRYWNHFFFMKNSSSGRVRRRQRFLVVTYFLLHPRSFARRAWQKLAAKF